MRTARDALNTLDRALTYIRREVHPDIAMSHLHVYLKVCQRDGITMPEVMESLGMTTGVISRSVKKLSRYIETDRLGNRVICGYDLVRTEPDLIERRRMAIYLTDKGKEVREGLINIMMGEDGS